MKHLREILKNSACSKLVFHERSKEAYPYSTIDNQHF